MSTPQAFPKTTVLSGTLSTFPSLIDKFIETVDLNPAYPLLLQFLGKPYEDIICTVPNPNLHRTDLYLRAWDKCKYSVCCHRHSLPFKPDVNELKDKTFQVKYGLPTQVRLIFFTLEPYQVKELELKTLLEGKTVERVKLQASSESIQIRLTDGSSFWIATATGWWLEE